MRPTHRKTEITGGAGGGEQKNKRQILDLIKSEPLNLAMP